MSPSPPFPSPLPSSHSSHPGIIGEHRGALQPQQAAAEPPNGEYLLHLLQAGSQLQHNVANGDGRGGGGGGGYDQQAHYSFSLPGIVSGGDGIPMAAWDPAVAALGPSHSYSHNVPGGATAADGRDFLPGLYPPQYNNASMGSGWATHQQHTFPSGPPAASSSSSISSSLSSSVDLRLIQGRSGGHTLVPIPGSLPSSLYGSHIDMLQRRPAEWHQNLPLPPQQQQLRGMLTESDISPNSSNLSPNLHTRVGLPAERSPHQQFFGDGAELKKLLQISSSKSTAGATGTDPKLDKQSGLLVGGSCSAVHKVSPAIVHGPIGPPRRNENNKSSPADDLLGRFWPAPAVSVTNVSQDMSNTNVKLPGFASKENQANFGSFPISKERGWWGDHPAEKFDLSGSCESMSHPIFGNREGARFGVAGRLYAVNKGGLPDSVEYHGGRGLLGGWGGDYVEDGGVAGQQYRKSGGNRPREEFYAKAIEQSTNLSSNHQEPQHGEVLTKESDLDYSRDNGRMEGARGVVGGRRGPGSRGEICRRGGRTVVGQWVAVNERQRERDGVEISGQSEGAESGSEKGSNSTGNSCKEETIAVSKEGSGSQKARDDLKRRRGQQQEWRMKTPPSHSQIQAKAHCSLAKISDISSGADSPELLNGDYRVSSPLKIRPLALQVDHPGLPSDVLQNSPPMLACAMEEPKKMHHDRASDHANGRIEGNEEGFRNEDEEELAEAFAGYLDLVDEREIGHRQGFSLAPPQEELNYEARQEHRESRRNLHRTLASPSLKPEMRYRPDLEKYTPQMLAMYQSLIPSEEEEQRRRQFLSHLDQLVAREWPGALLFLFGSCANAFGVCNSDIDVCLSINDDHLSKADLVLKMAAILRSDNMQNVQALTHARVPIVKFTDGTTGISCDICVNNMLAVVNSKLLHDYSQIDVRLRQLAFLVKHWAKRRQVNETYRGTLSSYAYVLMCIHFLQQRKPAILPCLQDMRPTYKVNVGNINCAYYDQVETLQNFGVANKETLGELLTSFFEYWAFRHDYNRAVISVRTGGYLSKDEKEWTRRIGNERHLICIEDPLEIVHDLGRVVDRHSIRVLRDEFHRAAKILRHDLNPCMTLFEPFIREKP